MIWILIIVYSTAGGVATQEFYSQESCTQARQVIERDISPKISRGNIHAVCVPKGNR
jgi:hypothetical protein